MIATTSNKTAAEDVDSGRDLCNKWIQKDTKLNNPSIDIDAAVAGSFIQQPPVCTDEKEMRKNLINGMEKNENARVPIHQPPIPLWTAVVKNEQTASPVFSETVLTKVGDRKSVV